MNIQVKRFHPGYVALPVAKVGSLVTLGLLFAAVGCGSGSSSSGAGSPPSLTAPAPAFGGINMDYAPEGRCSDDNWSTATPAACNPQLSFTSCTPNVLSSCAANCQACYNADMATMNSIKLGTITIYQPNYYILKAADSAGIKVVLGLFNDSVSGLAQPSTATNCTYGGQPFPYCGTKYATALFGGACGNVSPWAAATFCERARPIPMPRMLPRSIPVLESFCKTGPWSAFRSVTKFSGSSRPRRSARRPRICAPPSMRQDLTTSRLSFLLSRARLRRSASEELLRGRRLYCRPRLLFGWQFRRGSKFTACVAHWE